MIARAPDSWGTLANADFAPIQMLFSMAIYFPLDVMDPAQTFTRF